MPRQTSSGHLGVACRSRSGGEAVDRKLRGDHYFLTATTLNNAFIRNAHSDPYASYPQQSEQILLLEYSEIDNEQ